MARKRIQIPFYTIQVSIFGDKVKDIVIAGLKPLKDAGISKAEIAKYFTETLKTNVSTRTIDRRFVDLENMLKKCPEEIMQEDIKTSMSLIQRDVVLNDT